MPNLAV